MFVINFYVHDPEVLNKAFPDYNFEDDCVNADSPEYKFLSSLFCKTLPWTGDFERIYEEYGVCTKLILEGQQTCHFVDRLGSYPHDGWGAFWLPVTGKYATGEVDLTWDHIDDPHLLIAYDFEDEDDAELIVLSDPHTREYDD